MTKDNKNRPVTEKYNHAFIIVDDTFKRGDYESALKILEDMEKEILYDDFKSTKDIEDIQAKIKTKRVLILATKKGDAIASKFNILDRGKASATC